MRHVLQHPLRFCFFFNDTATTEIYTLSLHDALPISLDLVVYRGIEDDHSTQEIRASDWKISTNCALNVPRPDDQDRKSTRLNSSHDQISYAVFCLKKNTKSNNTRLITYEALILSRAV